MDRPAVAPPTPAAFDAAPTRGPRDVGGRAPVRERVSWALYDFAHTIFSMNITTLYFSVWLISDLGASSTVYATANAISSILVFLSIPVLGALSDERRRRKPWVVGFTLVAALGTVAIGVLGQTTLPLVGSELSGGGAAPAGWQANLHTLAWIIAAFTLANFAYQAALPFYNAMMPDLVPPREHGRLSGFGSAMSYVGSIVGVLLVAPFFNGRVPVYGTLSVTTLHTLRTLVPFTTHGGRVSIFAPTALLFLLFALPLFVFCKDHHPAPPGTRVDWRRAFREVAHTVRDARQHPGALRFILTALVYQDAIGTIISFMAIYAVRAVGFAQGSETTLFVVLTIPAVIGSYVYGRLADRIGPKRSLALTLYSWVALLCVLVAVPGKSAFWVIGFLIGLNYGGVVTCERPVLLSLVPEAEAGRYFSLMLLSARAAAIVGPVVWAVTVDNLEPRVGTAVAYRAAVISVGLMFVVALIMLRGVPNRVAAKTAA